jgi:hypothetical protein
MSEINRISPVGTPHYETLLDGGPLDVAWNSDQFPWQPGQVAGGHIGGYEVTAPPIIVIPSQLIVDLGRNKPTVPGVTHPKPIDPVVPEPIPEPGTYAMMGIALVGVLICRKIGPVL